MQIESIVNIKLFSHYFQREKKVFERPKWPDQVNEAVRKNVKKLF